MATQFELAGRVKNTFLDFRDEDSESDVDQRANSDPSCSASSRSSWSESTDNESCHLYKFRGENDLKQPVRSQMNMHWKTQRDYDQGRARQHHNTDQAKVPKKCTRPCKGRRERFRKYVDSLKSQVDVDPQGFAFGDVNLHENLVHDERARKKVASILENYRTQILSKGTETPPGAGALSCNAESSAHNPDIVSL